MPKAKELKNEKFLKYATFHPVYITKTSNNFVINVIVYRLMSRQVKLKA
jgi:hypothetical protein